MTEGYIKFNCTWKQEPILISEEILLSLDRSRSHLYELGLIGMYPDGIGFGNISMRMESGTFLITGSATGQFTHLKPSHYAIVSGYDFVTNSISCTGQTKASAESLTHAAVYEALSEVGAVVHVHCLWLWDKLLNKYPITSGEIEYGTPEMALAVRQLATESKESKILVMGGHREGILAFGKNLNEATDHIMNLFNRLKHD